MTTTADTAPAHTPAVSARGVTEIADRVVAKIAGRVARDVDGVLPAPAVGISRLVGGGADVTVDAHVTNQTAQLDIRLAVAYPQPFRTVARAVQTDVRATVERLTGLNVTSVHIDVAAARPDRPVARRVV